MPHLDEGMIHSWLDGALSADEAVRVEAHVAECPQCAAAVAEARGFIAASSRILTALDNAPRGVMPAAVPRKRVDPLVWRVAATVLVVAVGTLVVVRNYGSDERLRPVSTDRATLSRQHTSVAEQAPAATAPAATAPAGPTAQPVPSTGSRIALSGKAIAPNSRADIGARENKASAGGITVGAGQNAARSEIAGSAAKNATRVAGTVAVDAAGGPEPLRVVATPRRIGAKVTLYEVALGDTVTLTESMPTNPSEVVVTGAAASPVARQAVAKSTAPPSPMALAGALATQTGMANAPHTITWTDSATGSTLTLTGRMPEAGLQEIRVRIERERAAAKKNP